MIIKLVMLGLSLLVIFEVSICNVATALHHPAITSSSPYPKRIAQPWRDKKHQNDNTQSAVVLPMIKVDLSDTSSSYSNNNNRVNNNPPPPQQQSQLVKKKNLQTFARYLEIECWKRSELRDLEPVLKALAEAFKQINRIVQRAKTDDLYGQAINPKTGLPLEDNVQGEVQQKLDVLCNNIMLRTLCGCSKVIHTVASEEEDDTRCCSDVMNDPAFAIGDYMAVFDPLDGSKNIDASLPVGTIFGIYKAPKYGRRGPSSPTTLQTGRSLVASGYCLYSATTVFVITLGSGVDGFTLDPDLGQFLHTHKDIRIPPVGSIYSFNEAYYRSYQEPVQKYLTALKQGASNVRDSENRKVQPNARYIGALVGDVHNILINGGIYGYPATFQNKNGKLRLIYESVPMAYIMEQAGGAGSTGQFGRILDIQPTHIHERVPTFLGSIENVFEMDQFFQYYSDTTETTTPTEDGTEETIPNAEDATSS